MFQVPLWTSIKACVHPVWSLHAPLLLSSAASRLPASVLCVGVPVSVFCSAPPVLPCLSAPDIPVPRWFHCLLAPPCLSVASFVFWLRLLVSRSSALLWIWLFTFWVLPNFVGPWRVSLHPSLFAPFLVLVLCLSCFGLSVRGPLLCVVCLGWRWCRARLEPWTGLHCSELHWRRPVEFPALLSRAPASSKVCTHGTFSRTQRHSASGALLQLFTDNLDRTALLQTVLGRWYPDSFEQLCLALGDEPCDY